MGEGEPGAGEGSAARADLDYFRYPALARTQAARMAAVAQSLVKRLPSQVLTLAGPASRIATPPDQRDARYAWKISPYTDGVPSSSAMSFMLEQSPTGPTFHVQAR